MQNSKTIRKIKSETFTIEKAIERMNWRFTNENVKTNESKITINELDVNAIEFIKDWINRQKAESLQENLLFAKMYTYALYQEIEFYKDVQFATSKLNEVCSSDIQMLYDKIKDKLNELEYTKFCKQNGIVTEHIEKCILSKQESIKQSKLIESNKEKLKSLISGIWSKEKVYRSLNNSISEIINKFK